MALQDNFLDQQLFLFAKLIIYLFKFVFPGKHFKIG